LQQTGISKHEGEAKVFSNKLKQRLVTTRDGKGCSPGWKKIMAHWTFRSAGGTEVPMSW
jgi:hypothetical protein